jgi:hypothetical protein
MIVGIPAEIQTWHLSITGEEDCPLSRLPWFSSEQNNWAQTEEATVGRKKLHNENFTVVIFS